LGSAEIILRSSDSDPWAEVKVERILGSVFLKGNNSMRKGSVVAEVEPAEFLPYSFLKWDIEI
jgi:acetoacetate decarboxylase